MRPNVSHVEQGRDAYAEDRGRDACPYPADSLRAMEWNAGWIRARVGDPLAGDFAEDEDAFDFETMDLEGELKSLERAIRAVYGLAHGRMPSVDDLVEVVGPTEKWSGNCMGVATALHDSGLLDPLVADYGRYQVVYGCFTGWIAPDSIFDRGGINHHAWIEFENGLVVDPTRWVFHSSDPAIDVCSIEEYDLGGLVANRALRPSPAPAFNPEVPVHDTDDMPTDLAERLHVLLGRVSHIKDPGRIDYVQLMWLGKRTLGELGEQARPFYDWLEQRRIIAVVPIDNRKYLDTVLQWREQDAAEAAPSP